MNNCIEKRPAPTREDFAKCELHGTYHKLVGCVACRQGTTPCKSCGYHIKGTSYTCPELEA